MAQGSPEMALRSSPAHSSEPPLPQPEQAPVHTGHPEGSQQPPPNPVTGAVEAQLMGMVNDCSVLLGAGVTMQKLTEGPWCVLRLVFPLACFAGLSLTSSSPWQW